MNLSPTNRVIAGLGTRVVQMDREQLMQAAWAQVGSIDAANREIRRAQSARFVGASLHGRHLSKLNLGQLTQVTRGLQSKVKFAGAPLTVLGTAAKSAAAPAALTPAFRRVTRTRGPLARYIDAPARRRALEHRCHRRDDSRFPPAVRGTRWRRVAFGDGAERDFGRGGSEGPRRSGGAGARSDVGARDALQSISQRGRSAARSAGDVEAGEGGLRSWLARSRTRSRPICTRQCRRASRRSRRAPRRLRRCSKGSRTVRRRPRPSARESVHNIGQRLPIQHLVHRDANDPAAEARLIARGDDSVSIADVARALDDNFRRRAQSRRRRWSPACRISRAASACSICRRRLRGLRSRLRAIRCSRRFIQRLPSRRTFRAV